MVIDILVFHGLVLHFEALMFTLCTSDYLESAKVLPDFLGLAYLALKSVITFRLYNKEIKGKS